MPVFEQCITEQKISDFQPLNAQKQTTPTEVECRLFCCPILFDRCRFCNFFKLLSYRHTGNGRFLLRRLDPHSGRRNLQLQRRAASCYFQAGGYRPKIGAGLCAGPVNVSQKRSSAIFGLYFYKAYAIITRSK